MQDDNHINNFIDFIDISLLQTVIIDGPITYIIGLSVVCHH